MIYNMSNKVYLLIALTVVAVVVGGGWWWYSTSPESVEETVVPANSASTIPVSNADSQSIKTPETKIANPSPTEDPVLTPANAITDEDLQKDLESVDKQLNNVDTDINTVDQNLNEKVE